MMPRYKKARDKNEQSIVNILKTFGCTVMRSDAVDLIVGRLGKTYLLEVKTENGKLKPSQETLISEWKGHYCIVRSETEALRAVGVNV